MAKLSVIYGVDNNDYASGIASDALNTSVPDIRAVDEGAASKSNEPQDDSTVKVVSNTGGKADSKGNH